MEQWLIDRIVNRLPIEMDRLYEAARRLVGPDGDADAVPLREAAIEMDRYDAEQKAKAEAAPGA